MPTLLDEGLLAGALGALEGWQGDPSGISREIGLPAAEVDRLLAQVSATADAMDHHPEVARTGSGVSFTLCTHSAGGVTELDITMASRIDDFVRRLTGRPPTPVPEASGPDSQPGRADADVIADASAAAGPGLADDPGSAAEHQPAHGEPVTGIRSASGIPLTPLPDTAPGEPEPGLATDQGQGVPPGHGDALPDDRGGPGDPG